MNEVPIMKKNKLNNNCIDIRDKNYLKSSIKNIKESLKNLDLALDGLFDYINQRLLDNEAK